MLAFLLVDDHPIVTSALSQLVSRIYSDEVVIDTAVGRLGMFERLANSCYDVIVLDLFMAGSKQSIALLRAVLNRAPNCQVLIFSGSNSPFLALAALEQGACAFVCKSSSPHLMIEAIKAVNRREVFCDPAVNLESAQAHPWNSLSDFERQVLLSIARGECLNALATRYFRSYKTIAAHKYNALKKLGLDARVELSTYLALQGMDFLLDGPEATNSLGVETKSRITERA